MARHLRHHLVLFLPINPFNPLYTCVPKPALPSEKFVQPNLSSKACSPNGGPFPVGGIKIGVNRIAAHRVKEWIMNPGAIASRLEAMATRLKAIASTMEAIAIRLEAVASRLEAIAIRLLR